MMAALAFPGLAAGVGAAPAAGHGLHAPGDAPGAGGFELLLGVVLAGDGEDQADDAPAEAAPAEPGPAADEPGAVAMENAGPPPVPAATASPTSLPTPPPLPATTHKSGGRAGTASSDDQVPAAARAPRPAPGAERPAATGEGPAAAARGDDAAPEAQPRRRPAGEARARGEAAMPAPPAAGADAAEMPPKRHAAAAASEAGPAEPSREAGGRPFVVVAERPAAPAGPPQAPPQPPPAASASAAIRPENPAQTASAAPAVAGVEVRPATGVPGRSPPPVELAFAVRDRAGAELLAGASPLLVDQLARMGTEVEAIHVERLSDRSEDFARRGGSDDGRQQQVGGSGASGSAADPRGGQGQGARPVAQQGVDAAGAGAESGRAAGDGTLRRSGGPGVDLYA